MTMGRMRSVSPRPGPGSNGGGLSLAEAFTVFESPSKGARAPANVAKCARVARWQAGIRPEFLWGVVDRTVHVRHRCVFDMADPEMVPELVDDEGAVFARIIDSRGDDPNATSLRQRHVTRPLGVPGLELIGAFELFDHQVASPRFIANAPSGPAFPDAHRVGDELPLVGIELNVERVRDGVIALAGAR